MRGVVVREICRCRLLFTNSSTLKSVKGFRWKFTAAAEFDSFFDDGRNRRFVDDGRSRRFDFDDSPRRQRFDFDQGTNSQKFHFGKKTWKSEDLPNIKKDFYEESDIVASRSEEEIQNYLDKYEITTKGSDIPKPLFNFDEANFPEYITSTIAKQQWPEPTPIQAVGWPMVLSGRDVVGRAMTGSGKTATFLLPAIVHIKNQERRADRNGPMCLFLAPTRELVQQIGTVMNQFGRSSRTHHACVFGGASKYKQLGELDRRPEICIATPGRLLDFMSSGHLTLDDCSYLVLDEADRMLDMGFEPQIRKIVNQIRPDRQTLMWSATWPEDVQELAEDFLDDSLQIIVGSGDLQANENIEQHVCVCETAEKPRKLYELMKHISEQDDSKTLIFVDTKRRADQLERVMRSAGWAVRATHGDKSQSQRDYIIKEFRNGRISVLIATDVASRGLDVSDIKYVINYDFPKVTEDYIHRIGRTGRAANTGTAHSLFTIEDASSAKELIEILENSSQTIPEELYELRNMKKPGKPRRTMDNRSRFSRMKKFQHFDNGYY